MLPSLATTRWSTEQPGQDNWQQQQQVPEGCVCYQEAVIHQAGAPVPQAIPAGLKQMDRFILVIVPKTYWLVAPQQHQQNLLSSMSQGITHPRQVSQEVRPITLCISPAMEHLRQQTGRH